MGWLLLEVALALAIAIGIVWWTMPRRPKSGSDSAPRGGKDASED